MISEGTSRNMEWDAGDQLRAFYIQAGTSEPSVYTHYQYDAGGIRIKKLTRKSSGNTQVSIYIDGAIDFHYEIDNTGNRTEELCDIHVMDDRQRIARREIYGSTHTGTQTNPVKYNLEDHLGNGCFTLDANGALYSREEYFPFGETSFGSYAKKRYRFVGKERDEESGLYYYGARYYAAWTCRFISIDPLAGQYAGINPYHYALNSPINLIDVDGLAPGGEDPPGGGGESTGGGESSQQGSQPKAYTHQFLEGQDGETLWRRNYPDGRIEVDQVKWVDGTAMVQQRNSITGDPQGSAFGKTVDSEMENFEGQGGEAELISWTGYTDNTVRSSRTDYSNIEKIAPLPVKIDSPHPWEGLSESQVAIERHGLGAVIAHDIVASVWAMTPLTAAGGPKPWTKTGSVTATIASMVPPVYFLKVANVFRAGSIAKKLKTGWNTVKNSFAKVTLGVVSLVSKKPTGYYRIVFESGKTYVGKGGARRMRRSIRRIERQNPGEKATNSIEWHKAGSHREAFKKEHELMMKEGGPLSYDPDAHTYNKIFSPGRHY